MKVEIKDLSEVAFYQEGPGVRTSQFVENNGVKLINVTNISNGKLNLLKTKTHISKEEAFGKYKHFLLEPNDIVMASSGATWGKTCLININDLPLCMNTSVIRFRPLNEKILMKEYLKIVLDSIDFKQQIKKLITGAAQPNFGPTHLGKVKISVPSLPDQIQTVTILSKAENLISQRKESIRLLDEFLKSSFLEMFGDPGANPYKWNLSKLANCFLDKPLIGSMVPAIENGTIPIVRVGEIGSREINFRRCKFSNLNSGDLNKYRLKEGDILLARAIGSESHLGKASIFSDRGLTVVYDSHVMRLRFDKSKIHPEFFYTFLQSQGGRKRFMQKAGQTSIQFNVNSKQISDIDIPVPPISLQTLFAQIVEKTESLKTQYQQSLQELENLYGSLSQQAFKGELTVKPIIA